MVLHVHDRQIEAHPLAHLFGKTAGSINQVLADNAAFVCNHLPLAAVQQTGSRHPGVAIDLGAAHAGPSRHGVGCAGWIGMAIVGGEKTHLHVIHDQQRMEFSNLIWTD